MVVAIIWSETTGGAAIAGDLVWANINNGANDTDELFITHDGAEKITSCAFYIQAYSGAYSGGDSAANDYTELMSWGAGDTEGFLINQDHLTAPPGSYVSHKTGRGTAAVPITLESDSIVGGASLGNGEIEGSDTGTEESHIKVKIAVPAAESTAGTRQFDQCIAFTYTS